MLRKSWRTWKEVDPVLSLGGYVLGAASILGIPVGVLMAWAFSQLAWFWSTFAWAGVLFVGLVTWLLVGVGLIVFRHARDTEGRKLDPLLAIAAVAALVLIGCLIGYARKTDAAVSQSNSSAVQTNGSPLIKGPLIHWDRSTGRISLQGRYTRPGGPLSVYVTYELVGAGVSADRSTITVVGGTGVIEPRIKVDALAHFDQDELVDLTLGFVTDDNGKILQWGLPQQNKTKIGISFGNYFANVILVWNEGKSVDSYPFALVATFEKQTMGKDAPPPLIIGPDILLAQQQRTQAK